MKIDVKVSDGVAVGDLKYVKEWAKELRRNPDNVWCRVLVIKQDVLRNVRCCGCLKCEITIYGPYKACVYLLYETIEGFARAYIGIERASVEDALDGWELDGAPIIKEYKEV